MTKDEARLAYCGLTCAGCPIYLAAREEDPEKQAEMRARIAGLINEKYGTALKPEEVTDCDGCRSDTGRLFSGCMECEVRKCALEKGVETCAGCADYPCAALEKIFDSEPEARRRLEHIRNG